MNILVIGSGCREHAVAKCFSQSPLCKQLYCSTENAGLSQIAISLKLDLKNHQHVVDECKKLNISFVFIGPEDPLVDGLSDSLRQNKIAVFGPSKEAAQLEGSKIFAKNFMQQAQVPTAAAVNVTNVEQTLKAAEKFTAPYVLKADGLAAGKGVFICDDLNELKSAAEKIFVQKIFGGAGASALLEQNLKGYELSYLVLTDGHNFQALPIAQDHKRLLDENKGPNTGGMGTIAPLKIDSQLNEKILKKVVQPSIRQLEKNNYLFRGVLFIGLMIVENEPYVLEYNVRFGDPETQVILPLIKNDILELFYNLAEGTLNSVITNSLYSFCIVNAAEGYPESVVKDTPIELPTSNNFSYILHAGTRLDKNQNLVVNGGRVLNVVSVSNSLQQARQQAYELNDKIKMRGRQFRTDIGRYFPDF
jgi:phosphoribosylamine---glycine ligase